MAFYGPDGKMRIPTESERILATLQSRSEKWGFVVYRCCSYDNNERWVQFMKKLNEFAMYRLGRDEAGEQIKHQLDWDVQEDPALDGCAKDEVRRRHQAYVESLGRIFRTPRHTCPMYVDEESLESVLAAPAVSDDCNDEILDPTGYVILLDMFWKPGYGLRDEGFPPIEDCRSEDVGWMKLAVWMIVPRVYNILTAVGWPDCYERPPKIAEP